MLKKTPSKRASNQAPPVDFDAYWKFITTALFPQFVAYFFPAVYPLIDFAVPPVHLEQELVNRYNKARKGKKRIADKLVKLQCTDGTAHVSVHTC